MKITICGSVKFIAEMRQVKSDLEKIGHEVLIPFSADLNQDKVYWNKLREENLENFASMKAERMKGHFDKIKSSEAILVLNYDKDGKKNYIGPNTFLEMGVAFDSGKKIFVLNPILDSDPNYEELLSMAPICLEGDLKNRVIE